MVGCNEFVSRLRQDLSAAADIARKHSRREQTRHAQLYNLRVKGHSLAVGDRVLLAVRGEKARRKLSDKWESVPYDIVSVRPDINVYRIKDTQTGREKIMHRNLLLPVNFLSLDEYEPSSSLMEPDHSAVAEESSQRPVVVDPVDRNVQTMDWLLSIAEVENPAEESDMDVNLSMAAESDSLSHCSAEAPDMPESDPAEADPSLETAPASIVCRADSVSTVFTPHSVHSIVVPNPDTVLSDIIPDSATVSVAPGLVSAPLAAAQSPDPGPQQGNIVCRQPQSVVTCQPGRATTRVGRHVRPPRRLICETQRV